MSLSTDDFAKKCPELQFCKFSCYYCSATLVHTYFWILLELNKKCIKYEWLQIAMFHQTAMTSNLWELWSTKFRWIYSFLSQCLNWKSNMWNYSWWDWWIWSPVSLDSLLRCFYACKCEINLIYTPCKKFGLPMILILKYLRHALVWILSFFFKRCMCVISLILTSLSLKPGPW